MYQYKQSSPHENQTKGSSLMASPIHVFIRKGWRIVMLLSLLGATIVCCWGESPVSDGRYRTVFEGVKYRESLIENVSGELTCAIWYLERDGSVGDSLCMVRFALADSRSRVSAIGLLPGASPWECSLGFEGPFFKLPGSDRQTRSGWPMCVVVRDATVEYRDNNWLAQGSIRSQEDSWPVTNHDPFCKFLLLGYQRASFAGLLRLGLDGGLVSYLGQEEVEGQECHVVFADSGATEQEVWYNKFWVCEDLGWAVVRSEHTQVVKPANNVTTVHVHVGRNFEEVDPGIWLPTESEYELYKYGRGLPQPWVGTYRLSFSGLRVNSLPTNADFKYQFPLGTAVVNESTVELSREFGRDGREILREFEALTAPTPEPQFNVPDYELVLPESD